MAIPINKTELQAAITINYTKLQNELINIPFDMSNKKELEGHSKGTFMSVNNLLAYLVTWGELVLKWIDKKDHLQKVDFPETDYKWNELGKLAAKFYKDCERDDFTVLEEKLQSTFDKILKVINAKPNVELYETTWYEKRTLGRMIQFNTAFPYTNAKARLHKWKKDKTSIIKSL